MSDAPRFSARAEREMEERFEMDRRLWQLMDIVCAEWQTDPESVAYFDLRIVDEACALVKRRKAMNDVFNPLRAETPVRHKTDATKE
jgi:hypothetical protein